MSKLEDNINEIYEDLDYIDKVSNEELLAICARDKIIKRSKLYEEEFDKFLLVIEKKELNKSDFKQVSHSLNKMSKLITESYDGLIKEISRYEKNIFKVSD